MLETPHRTGSSEAGLYLVQDQQCVMPIAPLAQGLYVVSRREGRACTLIGFEHHSGHILRIDILIIETTLEIIEGCVRSPKAVRKRDLREAGIQVADPFFQSGNAAGL